MPFGFGEKFREKREESKQEKVRKKISEYVEKFPVSESLKADVKARKKELTPEDKEALKNEEEKKFREFKPESLEEFYPFFLSMIEHNKDIPPVPLNEFEKQLKKFSKDNLLKLGEKIVSGGKEDMTIFYERHPEVMEEIRDLLFKKVKDEKDPILKKIETIIQEGQERKEMAEEKERKEHKIKPQEARKKIAEDKKTKKEESVQELLTRLQKEERISEEAFKSLNPYLKEASTRISRDEKEHLRDVVEVFFSSKEELLERLNKELRKENKISESLKIILRNPRLFGPDLSPEEDKKGEIDFKTFKKEALKIIEKYNISEQYPEIVKALKE